MLEKRFELDEHTLPLVEELGAHMPGGVTGIVINAVL